MKFIIDSAIPFVKGVFEPYAEVVYRPGESFSREEVADADMLIIRTRTKCNARLLEGSKVRMIATATIGFDHIDLDYCATNGIEVVTAQGCNAAGVLQWVAAALAIVCKQECCEPHNRTLGIVGVGHVGSLVEQYAKHWGFNVLCCDPPRQLKEGGDFISLEELLQRSDIVTLHTPLDTTTHHMICPESMTMMRPNASLINASRGEVAQSKALLDAPQQIILDVWEHEPAINRELLAKARLATPHIAGYSKQGKANASVAVVRAAARRFSLPLTDWYPAEVTPATRCLIDWEQMCDSITRYCDLEAESLTLKQRPNEFEALRNNYNYREEYF